MRTLHIIRIATSFYLILAVSHSAENYQILKQNSKTARDIESEVYKAESLKLLHNGLLATTLISSNKGNSYKYGKFYLLPTKHRIHRRSLCTKPNVNSRTLIKDNQAAVRFASIPSFEEIDLFSDENDFEDIVFSRRRTSRSDHEDTYDTTIYDSESFDDQYPFHLESLLTRLFEALQNDTVENDRDVLKASNSIGKTNTGDDEDRCQKWLDNRERLERAFPGSVIELPACLCRYPNSIFYENLIWDKKQRTNFQWRDASHESQRINIYKPGATYCIRSLPMQGYAAAQHCCYDENRRLLTRGSGAGTPYIVSPDMSLVLHDKIDLLPWRLCKGDFTRYNKVRVPNNDNNCEINPDDEEYQHQVENAKNY